MRTVKRITDEEYIRYYGLSSYISEIPSNHECYFRVYRKGNPFGDFTQTTEQTSDGLNWVVHLTDTSNYVGKYILEMKITIPTQVSALDIEQVPIEFKL